MVFLFIIGMRTGHFILFLCSMLGALLLFFMKWLSRNPARMVPQGDGLIVSAADGRVVSLEYVKEDLYIGGEGILIGVYLSLLDVHINRIPLSGVIRLLSYKKGKFLPAFRERASVDNEQQIIGIESHWGNILMKQIAGSVVRRIVCHLHFGESVKAGDPFGMIKLGSRVELVLPPRTEINVKIGDKVRAGETIIGIMK